MASEPCYTCPSLRAQIRALEYQVEQLHMRLSGLRAVVAGQVRFIAAETEPGEATMPRDKALKRVQGRLTEALIEAGGRV